MRTEFYRQLGLVAVCLSIVAASSGCGTGDDTGRSDAGAAISDTVVDVPSDTATLDRVERIDRADRDDSTDDCTDEDAAQVLNLAYEQLERFCESSDKFPVSLAVFEEQVRFTECVSPESCSFNPVCLDAFLDGRERTLCQGEPPDPLAVVVGSPDPVDFGRVRAGENSVETLSLTNQGTDAVTITEVLPLDPSGEFSVEDAFLRELPRRLEAEEVWLVDLTYAPFDDSEDEAPLQIEYLVDGVSTPREEVVTLIANGAPSCISVTHEDGYAFGPSLLNQTREATFTITNCSNGDDARNLRVSSLSLLDTVDRMSADSFGIVDAPAIPFELNPGQTSTFAVTYTPTSLDGLERAWLEIRSTDAAKSPLVIEIDGIGANTACPTAVVTCTARGTSGTPTDSLTVDALATVECSAAGSFDLDGSIVGYTWGKVGPESSSTSLSSTNRSETSLFIDAIGTYTVSLNVLDDSGLEACSIATATIEVAPSADITVELFWSTPTDFNRTDTGNGAGADMDLHLLHLSRGCWNDIPYDCHWRNTRPDWGIFGEVNDNPVVVRDDADGWGPELVGYDNPETSDYRVGVEYWDDWSYGASTATVRIYLSGSMVFERTREFPSEKLFWEVADVQWPSGAVVSLDRTFPTISASPCN